MVYEFMVYEFMVYEFMGLWVDNSTVTRNQLLKQYKR